jgi:L,D-peptidoglycan transpeptidase YkuD (ErfK/YbiS/YcfS/YnhG family)
VSPDDLIVSPWGTRFQGQFLPSSIGKGGLTREKREGDGATPIGTHQIVEMLYRPDRIPRPAPWARAIRHGDLWSDDMDQPDYNHLVQTPYPHSHERLMRADPLYDLVLVTDWNYPDAVSGQGSAIFVHRWRKPRHPTEGCVAYHPMDLAWIASQITPGTRLIVRG